MSIGCAERRDGGGIAFALYCKEIDVEATCLQKSRGLIELVFVVVVSRNQRVGAEPTVGDKFAILRGIVCGGNFLARHMAGLAGRYGVFHIEGQWRLLGERRDLPLV